MVELIKPDPIAAAEVSRKRQKGVTTVEYVIMLVLVALAVLIAAPTLRNAITGIFSDVEGALEDGRGDAGN